MSKTASERFAEMFRRFEHSEARQIEDAKVELSEQIYVEMKRQKVTNAELAKRLGTSSAYVTKILQGNANFTIESLIKIARALNCNLDVRLASQRAKRTRADVQDRQRFASRRASQLQRGRQYPRLVDNPVKVNPPSLENNHETFEFAA